MARMRRACLASAVRAASARNCEILKSWCVISIADMLPAPRINDMLHRVTVAVVWESPQESGSQAAGIIVPLETSRRRDKDSSTNDWCDGWHARGGLSAAGAPDLGAKQEKGLRGYGIGRSCDPSGYGNRGHFSIRAVVVKRFQANNSNFCRSRARASLRDQPLALPAWDQQEETEQSDSRTDRGRAIDTRVQSELVSSIVPQGT